jgi:hypothetical protein
MLTWAKSLVLLGAVVVTNAVGLDSCVSFSSSNSSFPIFASGRAAIILIDAQDWPGVQRAASDFVADIARVSGQTPVFKNASASTASGLIGQTAPIIVGTLGHSDLLDALVERANIDTSKVKGKWEAYQSALVKDPLPGIDLAYVIIGSDKRGTIYGLYDHSEQIGMSRHSSLSWSISPTS